jgi:hypothetical protein
MAFTEKNWQNGEAGETPLDAAALQNMEFRLSNYTDERVDSLAALGGVVDAREYDGIDLTGTNDSTTDLRLAISEAATAGRRLYLPAGTIVAAQVFLKSNTHIFGAGSRKTILKLLPSATTGLLTSYDSSGDSVDDVVLEDFTLDGQRTQSTVVGTAAGALLHSYEAARWHLRRLRIMNSRGYGFGWQGRPDSADPLKTGPQTDLFIESCEFYDNGYLPDGTPNSADNIDVKSSERVTLVNVYSRGASDKGINIRGRYVDLVGCRAYANVNGMDLNAINDPANADNFDSYFTVQGGSADANSAAGLSITSTEDQRTYATVVGFSGRKNGGNGFSCLNSTNGKVHVSVIGGAFIGNGVRGIGATGAESVQIEGATCRDNVGDGVRLTDQNGAKVSVISRGNGGYGVRSMGTSDRVILTGSDLRGNTTGTQTLVGSSNVVANNITA